MIATGSSHASALVERIGEKGGIYAGIGDNAILLILVAQLAQMLWASCRWIVNKYFREQHDKDAEVKKLKTEFQTLHGDVHKGFAEIKAEMRGLGRLPSETEIMERLENRLEFLVFKVVRDLGKGKQ